MLGGQLIRQHPTVMPDNPGTNAAVMELMRDGATTAVIVDVVEHHARIVILTMAVAAHPLPARGPLVREASARVGQDAPPAASRSLRLGQVATAGAYRT